MVATQEVASKETTNKRQFRSPNRVLVRSFRIGRDKWKRKYMDVRADLKLADRSPPNEATRAIGGVLNVMLRRSRLARPKRWHKNGSRSWNNCGLVSWK